MKRYEEYGMNTIFDRRSIRRYEERRVEDEKIERVLRLPVRETSRGGSL